MDYYKTKRTLKMATAIVIIIILMCGVTFTKDNEYTKVNNMISVLFMNKPLIEKGIIQDEN